MATFFGEVVSVFSRAVEEDEDDDDEEEEEEERAEELDEEDQEIRRELAKKREVMLTWSCESSAAMEKSAERPALPCSSLILAVGDNASGFLSAYILSSGSWEVAGYIRLWNERCRDPVPKSDAAVSPSSCIFYRSVTDPSVMLCLCKSYVAEDQQFQWCEKVFSCLQKSGLKVTVLSTCPVTDYKTTESTHNLPVPFLRVTTTKQYSDSAPCSYLEQPNIVDGLPAAVMAHCQVWGIPAVFYQCYTDITKLDSVTIEAFRPLLSCQNMSRLAAKSEKIEETLKKTVTTVEIQSNLYI
ncbi:proteasome assembly chaperone 1 isoform X2 [Hyla sarda]|uniref:proteasome assembly chaperone 1 isoform X2 n=1 Tax=Hyla sarda TaxID=327740 RepID=UPI0024C3EDDE|nr:proteasome assembly chaperone 1 isoform X2 [Hyla sarda]